MQLMHLACIIERHVEAAVTCDELSRALASVAALCALVSPSSTLCGAQGERAAAGSRGQKSSTATAVPQQPAQAVMLRTLARVIRQCLTCMQRDILTSAHHPSTLLRNVFYGFGELSTLQ